MPNPSINIGHGDQAEPRAQSANGILAYVQGPDVARGSQTLPLPGQAQSSEPTRKVELDAQSVGMVRLTYELHTYKHGRSRHWSWRAVHAERIEGGV